MARKHRTTQRKKGSKDSMDNGNGDDGLDIDHLSESHTIGDTSFASSFVSIMDEDDESVEEDDLYDRQRRDPSAREAARHGKLCEALETLDEFVTEKRAAKREARLKRLFQALTQAATGCAGREQVEGEQEAIRKACLFSLRPQASPAEQYAACRCLETTAVILGADQDDWVQSLEKHLERAVNIATRAIPVRVAALRAWALGVLVCTSDSVATEQLMDRCESWAQETYRGESVPDLLRAAALDAWTLLATTVEDVYLAGQDDIQVGRGLAILPLLNGCLDSRSMDLRSAAGECLALIHESRLNLGVMDGECENTTDRKFRRGSWEGSSWEELMDEVKQRIAELAVESDRNLSKKAKKEQRATFREFVSTIVDDEDPLEVVSFRNGSQLTLSTWREIIQLGFLRHCLQSGFQVQLLSNSTLQSMFGIDGRQINAAGGMSQIEKRLLKSKSSEAAKEADQDLNKRRTKRENIKNHFLTADGEDI